jgi:hypothetical protein
MGCTSPRRPSPPVQNWVDWEAPGTGRGGPATQFHGDRRLAGSEGQVDHPSVVLVCHPTRRLLSSGSPGQRHRVGRGLGGSASSRLPRQLDQAQAERPGQQESDGHDRHDLALLTVTL